MADNQLSLIKNFFNDDKVKNKFAEIMGKKAQGFITSVMQVVASNKLLAKADPVSIYQAAAVAATLDLPINNNLGFAYIIPYKQQGQDVAQFQIGYKGFIQLAQRSGQFKSIGATRVCEGQLVEENPLLGHVFDWRAKTSDTVIGYAAHFSLLNGFEKTLYMSMAEVNNHAGRFSQTFKKGFGIWKDDFDSMAIKTVIKLLLSKYAPLSIDMQQAMVTDQSVVKDAESNTVEYVDAEAEVVDKEDERVELMIQDAQSIDDLYTVSEVLTNDEQRALFESKKQTLFALENA